ncbi:hypothetical protein VKS41_004157 [Umbelopsis sp. WA50703]
MATNTTNSTKHVPPTYSSTQYFDNSDYLFTSTDISSNRQCMFSLDKQNQTLFYTCFTLNADTTFTTDSWLTISLRTSQSSSAPESLDQIALDIGEAQASISAVTSSFAGDTIVPQTSSGSSENPRPNISGTSQSQSCSNLQCSPANSTSSTGTMIATKSHLLLLGWPQAANIFHANVSAADSDAMAMTALGNFDFLPISNNISFSSGTGTGIGDAAFVYLKYGDRPELLYFTIDSSGSISLDKSVAINGSDWVTGDIVLMPDSFSISNVTNSKMKRTELLSLIISGMDSHQNSFVLATDPSNPSLFLSLNDGDHPHPSPTVAANPSSGISNQLIQASSNVNTGAIVGGTIGGLVAITICIGLFLFIRRRSRKAILQRHIIDLRNSNPRSHFEDLIDERPVHSRELENDAKQHEPPMSEISAFRAAILSQPLPTLILPSEYAMPESSSEALLTDYTHRLLPDIDIDISEYTGVDNTKLQKDLKPGDAVFEDSYILTAEPPAIISQYYTMRTATKRSERTEQVSLHFFKDSALHQQRALVTFSTLLQGKHIIKHMRSYKLPKGRSDDVSAITMTESCSNVKSLSRLLHPTQGDLSLVDSTEAYFQRLTIKSLLLALQHLHRFGISHLDLSTQSFFHEGGCVTEWKLGKLEKCRKTGDAVEVSDFAATTAPEILTGKEPKVTKAGDIWTLGLTIYEIYCGKFLFDSLRSARDYACSGEQIYLDDLADERIQQLLARMLALNPEYRGNTDELLHLWEDGERQLYDDDDDLSSIEG